MLRYKLFSILFPAVVLTAFSQSGPERTYQIPVKLPPLLSGNFAELRNNHFHSGIDFKTQGTTGHPIFSFDEGWVSRISVAPGGYGRALYITHHNGMTTVYAHLDDFAPTIKQYLKDYQYREEAFTVDIRLEKDEIPVKRGEIVAKSGNTGGSGGPHLHFEIRDSATQDAIDPLPYFINKITDTTKPDLRAVRIYPLQGVVNGGKIAQTATPVTNENGTVHLSKNFNAWGRIGIGVKSYDRMDNTHHIYGVKQVRLFVDDSLHFSMQQSRFAFADTRYLNSLIDYADWKKNRSMVMKLYADPGNKLDCYRQMTDRGEIEINEERPYDIRLELSDAYGNKRVFSFSIQGKKATLETSPLIAENRFPYNQENRFVNDSVSLILPEGVLYRDLDFTYRSKNNPKGYADIHQLHDPMIPLHTWCELAITMTRDPLENKSGYYIANMRNGVPVFVGGTYEDGVMKGNIREFGSYTVAADTIAPVLSPVQPESWSKTGQIRYRISDAQTGVKSWRGEIDGNFALFENDIKSNLITYKIDTEKIGKGKKHTLTVILTDKCGNEKRDERTFYW